jgi:hypothetical protein
MSTNNKLPLQPIAMTFDPYARHIAHASLPLCSDIRFGIKIARQLPACHMVRRDRAS